MTSVSVLIPVFNGGEVLSQAIDNLLGQTAPPAEIVIADDGSRDALAGRVAVLRDRCESRGVAMIYVGFPQNRGRGAARNLALDAATGDLVAWYDVDDLWDPAKLAVQSADFERLSREHPAGRLLLTCVYHRYNEAGGALESSVVRPPPTTVIDDLVAIDMRRHIQLQTVFGPRDVFLRRRFDDGLNRAEDFDFAIRYAASGGKFVCPDPDGNPLVHYFSRGQRALDEAAACNRRVVENRLAIFLANHIEPEAFLAAKFPLARLDVETGTAPPTADVRRPASGRGAARHGRLLELTCLFDGSLLIIPGEGGRPGEDVGADPWGECVVLTAEGLEIDRVRFDAACEIAHPRIVDWFMAGGRTLRVRARGGEYGFREDLGIVRKKSGLIWVAIRT